ncbi:AAA family ATPase [Streptomyces sp. NL15-2K]|uniref:AAA family ATPase n=1 Tax=Streptomyces sp. NL15-2K TaxID=376149 RepID=UPI00155A13FA|nr:MULTISPECIES: AAA family ATPase [Actinomycetes]WKX09287.1 AAA family ATPase [Kutzneria buriramensis]
MSDLREQLRARVIGQDHAVEALVRAVTIGRSGLLEPDRPLAGLLFVGPTGVGKTQLVRALAEVLRSGPDDFCRVDMSALAQEHYAASLAGAPPGYAGSKEGLTVLDRARIESHGDRPGIVLFDEIEKAHPTVVRTLLHVLDSGRFTLSSGSRTIDFRNCVVVMTSNLGARKIAEHRRNRGAGSGRRWSLGRSKSRTRASELASLLVHPSVEAGQNAEADILAAALQDFFDPEFLNRFDEIVAFGDLDSRTVAEIAGREVLLVVDRLLTRSVRVHVTRDVVTHLARIGHDEAFGVRALKRAVRRELLTPLAEALAPERPRPDAPVSVHVHMNGGRVECSTTREALHSPRDCAEPEETDRSPAFPQQQAGPQALAGRPPRDP